MSELLNALEAADKSTGLWQLPPNYEQNRSFKVWIWDAHEDDLEEIQHLLCKFGEFTKIARLQISKDRELVEELVEEIRRAGYMFDANKVISALKLDQIDVYFNKSGSEISMDFTIQDIKIRSLICIRLNSSGELNSAALES